MVAGRRDPRPECQSAVQKTRARRRRRHAGEFASRCAAGCRAKTPAGKTRPSYPLPPTPAAVKRSNRRRCARRSVERRAMSATDTLTVLTAAKGKRAAKFFTRHKDGTVKNRNYDRLKYFAVESIPVDGIESLAAALDKVTANSRKAVIRGSPLPGINQKHTPRLLKPDPKTGDPPTFQEEP